MLSRSDKPLKIHPQPEVALEKLKKDFDFGRGVEVMLASVDDTGKRKLDYFFSSGLPSLVMGKGKTKRAVEIEMSSIEEENKELLHLLFSATKSSTSS